MFVVAVEFEIKKGKEELFKEAVTLQAKNSRSKEPACKQFDVAQDPIAPERFFLYEVYDDEAAFGLHRETPHFADFQRKIADLVHQKRLMTWQRLSTGE